MVHRFGDQPEEPVLVASEVLGRAGDVDEWVGEVPFPVGPAPVGAVEVPCDGAPGGCRVGGVAKGDEPGGAGFGSFVDGHAGMVVGGKLEGCEVPGGKLEWCKRNFPPTFHRHLMGLGLRGCGGRVVAGGKMESSGKV